MRTSGRSTSSPRSSRRWSRRRRSLAQALAGIAGNQPAMDRFVRVTAGVTSPAEMFAPAEAGESAAEPVRGLSHWNGARPFAAVGVYPPPVSSLRTLLETALARLAAIGADSRDDEETRVRKALLVLVSVLILPISLLWGGLYLALGAPSGVLAFVYFAISLGAIAVFARTRDFALFLRIELLDILLAPTLSMIPLGGFVTSTGVGVWGILAPMGALVFGGVRAGIRWYVAFLAVFLGVRRRGRGPGHHLPAADVVHDRSCWRSTSRSAGRSCSRSSRCSPSSGRTR